MSFATSQQDSMSSRPREHYELLSELRAIRITLMVVLVVLIVALIPWGLVGLDMFLDEVGTGGGGGGGGGGD
jgi:hypothetical protein